MKVINTSVSELQNKVLCIGFVGENERTQVRIDASTVFAEYPHATPSLAIKPPLGSTFPVLVDRDGTDVVWDVLNSDLQRQGDNEIQLTFIKDSVICKSFIGKARVLRSLKVDGETPTPVESWTDAANAKLAEVDAAIVALDEIDATATGLPAGTAPTVEVQDVDDHKRFAFGIPKGDQGIQGIQGEKGDTGATPELTIGTVSTLPEGSSASASITGTAEHPVLSLGIPKGDTGARGQTGAKGDTGNGIASIVKTGSSGLDDTYTVTYTNGTTTEFYVTNGKDGEDGQPGARGQTGATPDFSIGTVETLPAGSPATASITGTDEEPILNLGIPTGATGAQGEQGIQGEPGEGVPTGGYTGQVLAKASATDRDTEWIDVAPIIHSTASGAIATFTDGAALPVDSVTCEINPVQDLHGYESPWPAGGGKNLFHFSAGRTAYTWSDGCGFSEIAVNDDSVTINGTASSNHAFTVPNATLTLPAGSYFVSVTADQKVQFTLKTGDTTITNAFSPAGNTFTLSEETEINLQITILSGKSFSNEKVGFLIASGTTAVSWTPYSNICPITGHTAVNVTRTGKNLYDKESVSRWYYLDSSGNVVESNVTAGWTLSDYIYVSGASSLAYNGITITGNAPYWCWYDKNKRFISSFKASTGESVLIKPDNAEYLRCSVIQQATTSTDDVSTFCIVVGNTAGTYEPYSGTTYPITIPSTPGTVYGGSLTVAEDGTGTLVVDRAMVTLTGASGETWSDRGSTYGGYRLTLSNANINGIPSEQLVCNSFVGHTTRGAMSTWKPGKILTYASASDNTMVYFTTDIQTKSDWLSWLASNPIQLVYPLAQPQTYTLTASQITTLLGQNNVWHDANGEIEVGYKANTKLYIDGKIAELVAQIVNS